MRLRCRYLTEAVGCTFEISKQRTRPSPFLWFVPSALSCWKGSPTKTPHVNSLHLACHVSTYKECVYVTVTAFVKQRTLISFGLMAFLLVITLVAFALVLIQLSLFTGRPCPLLLSLKNFQGCSIPFLHRVCSEKKKFFLVFAHSLKPEFDYFGSCCSEIQ